VIQEKTLAQHPPHPFVTVAARVARLDTRVYDGIRYFAITPALVGYRYALSAVLATFHRRLGLAV
jgi:hypothetical protein